MLQINIQSRSILTPSQQFLPAIYLQQYDLQVHSLIYRDAANNQSAFRQRADAEDTVFL